MSSANAVNIFDTLRNVANANDPNQFQYDIDCLSNIEYFPFRVIKRMIEEDKKNGGAMDEADEEDEEDEEDEDDEDDEDDEMDEDDEDDEDEDEEDDEEDEEDDDETYYNKQLRKEVFGIRKEYMGKTDGMGICELLVRYCVWEDVIADYVPLSGDDYSKQLKFLLNCVRSSHQHEMIDGRAVKAMGDSEILLRFVEHSL